MNDTNQKAPGASRPSLMSAAPAASTTHDFPGGPTSPPTRVLADLGGSTSTQRTKTAVATLVSGVIVVAAGGIYWASTHSSNVTLAVNQTSPAQLAASALPARAPSDALLTSNAAAPAPTPAAAPEPVTTAARIVIDDTVANKVAPPVADAPAVAVAAAAIPPASPVASVAPPAAKAKTRRAANVAVASNRTAAAPTAKREKTRTASAKSPGKPTAVAANKPRSNNQAVASNQTGKNAANKRPDPDTDLLAALLRRGDGQTQASLAPKERVR